MSNTVTKAHFSRMCGISKAAVTKACAVDLIKLTDGAVNLDHRVTREYMASKDAKILPIPEKPIPKPKLPPKKKPAPKKTKKKPVVIPLQEEPIPLPDDNGYGGPILKSLDDINGENISLISKADIDKFKSYEQAMDAQLKREERRGLLIPRTMVRQVFAKLYTVDNNELKAIEDRVSPGICGIFGEHDDSIKAVEVRKLLNVEIIKALRHIKRIMNDHLKNVGEERL